MAHLTKHDLSIQHLQPQKMHMHENCAHVNWDQVNAWIRVGSFPLTKLLPLSLILCALPVSLERSTGNHTNKNTGYIDLGCTAPGMGVSSDGMEAGIPGKVFSTHRTPTTKPYTTSPNSYTSPYMKLSEQRSFLNKSRSLKILLHITVSQYLESGLIVGHIPLNYQRGLQP
jgi:hypothetical protein